MKKIQLVIACLLFSFHLFSQSLTEQQAVSLSRMPLHCIPTEYPNKTAHVINSPEEASMTPSQLHPSLWLPGLAQQCAWALDAGETIETISEHVF